MLARPILIVSTVTRLKPESCHRGSPTTSLRRRWLSARRQGALVVAAMWRLAVTGCGGMRVYPFSSLVFDERWGIGDLEGCQSCYRLLVYPVHNVIIRSFA